MNIMIYTGIKAYEKKSLGIMNKIYSQADAFEKNGHCVYYGVSMEDYYGIYRYADKSEKFRIPTKNRIIGRMQRFRCTSDWCVKNNISMLYVRFDYLDKIAYKMYRRLKANNVKIILEIPTFPFENEKLFYIKKAKDEKKLIDYLGKKYLLLQEHKYFEKARNAIDLIVTYNPTGNLFGIKTINIDNGVQVSAIQRRVHHSDSKEIIMILIANLSRWHGADRVIRGLAEYTEDNSYHAVFWVVGDGVEKGNLEKLVHKYKLEDTVHFLGAKSGNELWDLISAADIGIASLGMHRLGLDVASTLKVKEYCAYSLPFIYAYTEKEIDPQAKFALKLSADDSPVNIKDVISFAVKVRNDQCIAEEMRELAEEKYDWSAIVKSLLTEV